MPTFTAIALESLLEPRNHSNIRSTISTPFKHHQHQQKNHNTNNNNINNKSSITSSITKKHIYISSPALYTTPEPAPIPYSSAISLSPSPYVLNHKRRRDPEAASRLHGFEIKQQNKNNNHSSNDVEFPVAPSSDNTSLHLDINGLSEGDEEEKEEERNGVLVEKAAAKMDQVPHDFFNSRGGGGCDSMGANQTEFFDADEEFFSDHGSLSNASPSRFSNIEEVHAARVNLFDEIERRKRAENVLAQMRNRWQRIEAHLSQAGLSFPAMVDDGEDNAQLEIDMVEQFCQEVVVTRFVSEAIGKGLARAETEAAAEAVMESKNLEISRLRDKLQYYETVNREMFQRNQEVVEIARNQRDRRKTKQRWIWRCIGLSFTLGISLLAYSYLPEMSRDSPVGTADMSDVPSGTLDSS